MSNQHIASLPKIVLSYGRQAAKAQAQKSGEKGTPLKTAPKQQSLGQRVWQQGQSNRSSGSGVGGSNLRSSNGTRAQACQPVHSLGSSRPNNFGSRSTARLRSFGGGRRRR
ncbi:MAG: hypothetical protein ACFCBU_11460 [Cyanophyceae cyanobacterium]